MAPKEEPKAKEKEKDGLITAVYKTNLHCLQCARDIKRPLLRTQGVQTVEVDMVKGEIKAKGSFDPIKIQKQIEKLSKKKIELISPTVPIKDNIQTEKKVIKEKPAVSRTTSVKVQMHCDQCEKDLKTKLLMHKDIYNVKTDMKAQTLTVDGTIEPEKLVSFLRKNFRKHAEIIAPKGAEKKEEKKEKVIIKEEIVKKEIEKSSAEHSSVVKTVESYNKEKIKVVEVKPKEGNNPYFIHYVYAPQLFSDENPNACTIS